MLINSNMTGMAVLFKVIHPLDQTIGFHSHGLVKNSTYEEKK